MHPALALSSSPDPSFTEVVYDPSKDREWLEEEEEEEEEKEERSEALQRWNETGWDELVFLKLFEAAKEEHSAYNRVENPYRPFQADPTLAVRSKERSSDSWKLKLELKEQLAREAQEAKGIPPPGVCHRSDLWYTRFPTSTPSTSNPKPTKSTKSIPAGGSSIKRSKPEANPYELLPNKRQKRSSTPTNGAPVSPRSQHPSSPTYTPQSPTFSPIHSPPPEQEDVPDPEENEREGEMDIGPVGLGAGLLGLDQWDDSGLVDEWEQAKADWQARHGTTKSWLDLALEAQARGESLSTLNDLPVQPTVNKVAERNMARFKAVADAGPDKKGKEAVDQQDQLCYD